MAMGALGVLVLCTHMFLVAGVAQLCPQAAATADQGAASIQGVIDQYTKELKQALVSYGRQMMQSAEDLEERVRSSVDSGIKQIRFSMGGTRPYFGETASGRSFMAIHDHSNNIRTVGMGEFVAVLNGIELRTRHNDYRLNQPHPTSNEYHKTAPIAFPDVPPEVSKKTTVREQAAEMREWFRAWKHQDTSHRDYRKYFRPILCYLEGAWTNPTGDIDEPFESDRHFVDASNWFDLQEKIRFGTYAGRKNQLENLAYLPTKVFDILENGRSIPVPVFAQFNYRILCHPLKDDLRLDRFRVVDDFGTRMAKKLSLEDYARTRAARFQLDPFDQGKWDSERYFRYGLVDRMMSEVPGKDNYAGNITDKVADTVALDIESKDPKPLNAAYYNRVFKVAQRGAMGLYVRNRGYSDANLYVALTTQDKIAGRSIQKCDRWKRCNRWEQKVSYSIPLEIIFLTPLHKWNPYDIPFKGHPSSAEARTVTAGGRYGGRSQEKAFNGTHEKVYYVTPASFFSGFEVNKDAADTASTKAVGVLDGKGDLKYVRASGTRVFLPDIPSLGVLRTRYPIAPLAYEGNPTWKNLGALQDVVMDPTKYLGMLREKPTYGLMPNEPDDEREYQDVSLRTSDSRSSKIELHHHTLHIRAEDVKTLKQGGNVWVKTSPDVGHQHEMKLEYKGGSYRYSFCGGLLTCRDGHTKYLLPAPRQK